MLLDILRFTVDIGAANVTFDTLAKQVTQATISSITIIKIIWYRISAVILVVYLSVRDHLLEVEKRQLQCISIPIFFLKMIWFPKFKCFSTNYIYLINVKCKLLTCKLHPVWGSLYDAPKYFACRQESQTCLFMRQWLRRHFVLPISVVQVLCSGR